jgi:hypothetical protein
MGKSPKSVGVKLIPLPLRQIGRSMPPVYRDKRGDVTTMRRDAIDADAATDERGVSVRRSRVVLMPRRWRQVLEELTLIGDDDVVALAV